MQHFGKFNKYKYNVNNEELKYTHQWTIPQLTKILNSTSLDKNFITA